MPSRVIRRTERRPSFAGLVDRSTGRIRPLLWVGVGLAAFQQLVGINVVFYYGAMLWEAVGFTESDALKINILSGVMSVAAWSRSRSSTGSGADPCC